MSIFGHCFVIQLCSPVSCSLLICFSTYTLSVYTFLIFMMPARVLTPATDTHYNCRIQTCTLQTCCYSAKKNWIINIISILWDVPIVENKSLNFFLTATTCEITETRLFALDFKCNYKQKIIIKKNGMRHSLLFLPKTVIKEKENTLGLAVIKQ